MSKNYIYARTEINKGPIVLSNQIVELKEYAEKNNIKVDDVYSDLAPSGFLNPGMKSLLKDITENKESTVICLGLDRLARRVDEILTLTELVAKKRLMVHTVDGVIMGAEDLLINTAFKLLEIRSMQERMRRGREAKKRSRA